MDPPASKRQCVENILEDEIDLSIDWKGLKITNTVSQYRIPKKIYDISFSSTSPDVLYILINGNENILSQYQYTVNPHQDGDQWLAVY